MSELPTVVAAVADSETAPGTFEIARTLADTAKGGRLFAVHATGEIPPAMAEVLFPYACFGEDEDLLLAELVRTAHKRVSKRLQGGPEDDPIGDQLKVVPGAPSTAISDALSRIDSDLLVVGAGAKVGASWPTLGTTGHLLRTSHAPVLVVRDQATASRQLTKILVGVDLSEETVHLLTVALEWAQRTGGQIQPLYVVPDAAGLDHADLVEPRGIGRLKKAVNAKWVQIEGQLDPRFPIAENLKTLLRPRIVTAGEPGHKLVELATEAETDLVIVGRSRGTAGVAGSLGRVAEHVVRHAPCHVMVVPSRGADD